MVEFSSIQPFIISIALGALIGLEREYATYRKRGHDFAGIRTFPLIALSGTMAAFLAETISVWILVSAILVLGGLIVAAYIKVTGAKYLGATSEVAALITFFLGVLVYMNEVSLAIAIAIIITLLLYARSVLHSFAEKMNKEEMVDTLKFVVIAFLILPLLPNQSYGPLELFNPFVIWLMVVFISGISFAGYVLMRWFGERGIAIAGILGGLISSTATTTSFSERSKKQPKLFLPLVLGVILANGVMFIRVLFEVFVINRDLFFELVIPLLSLAIISAIASYFIWRKAKDIKGSIDLGSPFTLAPALKFAAFFAVILALVKIADLYLSSKGVYVVSVISGFADVDAITVSLAQLSKSSLDFNTARNGITLAALTNVAVKGAITWWLGGEKFRRIIVSLFTALIAVGLLLLFLL